MGIRKQIKKGVRKGFKIQAAAVRAGSGIVGYFVPGLGTVGEPVARLYDKLGGEERKRFHKAKTKAARLAILKKKK